jgi:hypothetical protein
VKILWSMVVVRGFSLCKHVNAGASVGEAGSWKLEAGSRRVARCNECEG